MGDTSRPRFHMNSGGHPKGGRVPPRAQFYGRVVLLFSSDKEDDKFNPMGDSSRPAVSHESRAGNLGDASTPRDKLLVMGDTPRPACLNERV